MTSFTDLIARLEAASGPDRELDRDIGLRIGGWRYEPHSGHGQLLYVPEDNCLYADHPGAMYPSFTESIDAAVALAERVLPGWSYIIRPNHAVATHPSNTLKDHASGGATAAIALLIATLKAKEAGDVHPR